MTANLYTKDGELLAQVETVKEPDIIHWRGRSFVALLGTPRHGQHPPIAMYHEASVEDLEEPRSAFPVV